MRSIVNYSMTIITALIVVACAREPLAEPASVIVTLKRVDARVSEIPQTRAHLEDGSKIIWDLSDRIGVFSDRDDAVPFSKTDSGNTFESNESVRGTTFYAFYPYSADTFQPEDRNNLIFTLVKGIAAGGPTPTLNVPMIAKSDNTTLEFKQTSGVIHFSIKGTFALSSVVLKGNAGEKVGGTFSVDLTESVPVLKSVAGSDLTETKFTPEAPIQLSEETAYDVYFVLPPMTFENGLSVIMTDEAGTELTKTTTHSVSVSRAVIKNFEVFDADELRETDDETLTIERNALIAIYNALDGANWTKNDNWCSDKPVGEWYGVNTNTEGLVTDISLEYVGLSGTLPGEFWNLSNLETIALGGDERLEGSISEKISCMKGLKSFSFCSPGFSGTIPDSFYECTELEMINIAGTGISGDISSKIGQLVKLDRLFLDHNRLTGNLPEELTTLPLAGGAYTNGNSLSGEVPEAFGTWEPWQYLWGWMVHGNKLDLSKAMPHVPEFQVTLLDGSTYSSEELANNKLTVLFQGATWCPYSLDFLPTLKLVYNYFHDKGLDVLHSFDDADSITAIESYIETNELAWNMFLPQFQTNSILGSHTYSLVTALYPAAAFPEICVFDSNGYLVWTDLLSSRNEFQSFIEDYMQEEIVDPDWYVSSDYSSDGEVHTLQTATEGAGINIVLMGDAFSDRLIADGTYGTVMNNAMEAFFSEEPYKSFRNLFNVYSVNVVSKNEVYQGKTALETFYGDGTFVGGNDDKTFEYARKALTDEQMDEALVIVMLNRDYFAGTCYMYYSQTEGDYGQGPAIAYFPTNSDAATFAGLVSHEAGGHGFAKLADEYSYEGTIPDDEAKSYKDKFPLGWWNNIDFTDDLSQVKWARFLRDERYANEGLGAYEGGCTYALGVWHPTVESIMNMNVGGFNAPSRYAIWYRIGKLAYGDDWAGSYEDFVAYDAVNRQQPTVAASRRNYVEKQLPPLAPPVIRNGSWRDAKR